MPGGFALYPDLSVAENLEFFAAVFGTTVEKGYELIAPIYKQIEPFRDRRADALSGGMKQKLAPSCTGRTFCSLTSRPPASTLCRGESSGISSWFSRSPASPLSSPRHTWTK